MTINSTKKQPQIGLLLLLCSLFLSVNILQAQDKDHPWAASVSLTTHQYNGDFGNEVFNFQSDSDWGFQIGLNRYLNDRLNLRFDFLHSTLDYNLDGSRDDASQYPPTGPRRFETATNMIRAGLTYDLLKLNDGNFDLYALGGLGVAFTNQSGEFAAGGSDESVIQTPLSLGVGFDKKISSALSWNLELSYQFLVGGESDNIEGTVGTNGVNGQFDGSDADGFMVISTGLKLGLGGKKDMDGDGVADDVDACPNVPGPAELNGCPDSDGDGVIDTEDSCPTVAGLSSLQGCPDADEDGITDADDKCPNVAGLKSLDGCPDADGDGVTDAEDNCPNVKGLASLNGCPDADGDGITDAEDSCPNEKGPASLNGCPDTDGDGILDANDKCPTVAGLNLFSGCAEYTYYLPFDMAEIPSDVITVLDEIVSFIQDNDARVLIIEGHADGEGTTTYNENLSKRRATRASKYFTDKGIDASKIQIQAFGETRPIDENDTDEGRAKNRRVVIRIDQ